MKLSELKAKYLYDPITGNFTDKDGKFIGSEHKYIYIAIGGKNYVAHRLAWFYMTGNWPDNHIDHINGIKTDNRFCNLRESTPSQNKWNVGKIKTNKSGYKGVSKAGDCNRWRAQICKNGKVRHLGLFKCPKEAHEAYKKAAIELHGEFAKF